MVIRCNSKLYALVACRWVTSLRKHKWSVKEHIGQDQFRNMTKVSIFCTRAGRMWVTQVPIRKNRQESKPTGRGGETKLLRQMKEGVLTDSVRMFRADGGHNNVWERSGPLYLRLVDMRRNPSPAVALARRLRSVLRERLYQADGGDLEIPQNIRHGWCVCIRRWMNNVETGERVCVGVSGLRGWVIGKADARGIGECEGVRVVRVRTWVDEARDAGDDAHIFSVVAPSCWRSGTLARRELERELRRRG